MTREEAIERIENLDNCYNQLSDNDKDALDMAIEALKLIPGNATNGDVIKALFPNVKIYRGVGYTGVLFQGGVTFEDMNGEWWNAPYKREGAKNEDLGQ